MGEAKGWDCPVCLVRHARAKRWTRGLVICPSCDFISPAGANRNRGSRRGRARLLLTGKSWGWSCVVCGKPAPLGGKGDRRPTLEHVIPRCDGGTNALWNLRISHQRCNLERGSDPLPNEAELIGALRLLPALMVRERRAALAARLAG